MRSKVAERLRREQFARALAMTPAERVALAHELGERALREFMTANGLDRETALRRIRRSHRIGRRPSHCLDSRDAD